MGEVTDKLQAAGDKIAGAAKVATGHVTGNDELVAEGKMQEGKSAVEHKVGEVKGALGDR